MQSQIIKHDIVCHATRQGQVFDLITDQTFADDTKVNDVAYRHVHTFGTPRYACSSWVFQAVG